MSSGFMVHDMTCLWRSVFAVQAHLCFGRDEANDEVKCSLLAAIGSWLKLAGNLPAAVSSRLASCLKEKDNLKTAALTATLQVSCLLFRLASTDHLLTVQTATGAHCPPASCSYVCRQCCAVDELCVFFLVSCACKSHFSGCCTLHMSDVNRLHTGCSLSCLPAVMCSPAACRSWVKTCPAQRNFTAVVLLACRRCKEVLGSDHRQLLWPRLWASL